MFIPFLEKQAQNVFLTLINQQQEYIPFKFNCFSFIFLLFTLFF